MAAVINARQTVADAQLLELPIEPRQFGVLPLHQRPLLLKPFDVELNHQVLDSILRPLLKHLFFHAVEGLEMSKGFVRAAQGLADFVKREVNFVDVRLTLALFGERQRL